VLQVAVHHGILFQVCLFDCAVEAIMSRAHLDTVHIQDTESRVLVCFVAACVVFSVVIVLNYLLVK
jgi:hypothetical protein